MPQAATQPTTEYTELIHCPDCEGAATTMKCGDRLVVWCSAGHVCISENGVERVVYTFGCLDAQAPQEDNDNADEL